MQMVQGVCGAARYPIYIGQGMIAQAGALLHAWRGRRVAVIADDCTAAHYGASLCDALRTAQMTPCLLTVPQGEKSKCEATLFDLYERLMDAGITRADAIVALGGGVVGDLAGFAAATYLRGVSWAQVPTTLLAQVDSAVGGKVAIDLPRGKNMVGAFYAPSYVLTDLDTLRTLPIRQLHAGLAEVIKYACIADAPLFVRLEEMSGDSSVLRQALPELVARCCILKTDIVARDPLEHGERMLLNWGHTWGHAVETVAGYGVILHGEAVAMGMVQAALWGERIGVTPPGIRARVARLLSQWGLPDQAPGLDSARLCAAMTRDKKATGEAITVVLLEEIGRAVLREASLQRLADWTREALA